ncbi:protein of unknown function (plasmid) [Cupriavidus taiwanensis]|uniref:Uncharacterized protein n=1 Tax=Cupriavidus taiwanensis TaxID=164546 RepID=A0A7Z7NNZ9_9BURK|nr:hypothetical protein [Cupriavidus taiwanensis]SOZ10351.1 protein of unknown function [Cupriavidus taiwanensis]SOZ43878.1 protein of unknown function [Cupriavidus taiwanensis]SPC23069.1 protein of unknown function [Cupriavidus taiwanensis]SPD54579.1 protein of unknown function [Cupriavidus taiwanensis]
MLKYCPTAAAAIHTNSERITHDPLFIQNIAAQVKSKGALPTHGGAGAPDEKMTFIPRYGQYATWAVVPENVDGPVLAIEANWVVGVAKEVFETDEFYNAKREQQPRD